MNMEYKNVLDKAGHEWLRIEKNENIFFMEYDISDTEAPEEEKNDLVYNYYLYKETGSKKDLLGADDRGVVEYDGGLLEICSEDFNTPQEIDKTLAELALFPKVGMTITRIAEPDWAQ